MTTTPKLTAQQGHETGPWEVRRGVYTGTDDLAVWPVGTDGRGENRVACWINSEANARLIAATPELLAACEMFDAACIGDPVDPVMATALAMARAAIAKAKGDA